VNESEAFEARQRLQELEEEERLLSSRRRKLHDRMAMYPDSGADLEAQERELSNRRRELHREIDELRARLGGGDTGGT
jgi:chromosome segregation ATPase